MSSQAAPPSPPAHASTARLPYRDIFLWPLLGALPAIIVLLLVPSDSYVSGARTWAWAAVDLCALAAALAFTSRRKIQQLARQARQSQDAFLANFAKAQRVMQRHALVADCLLLLGLATMLVTLSALDPAGYYYAVLIVVAIFVPYCLYKLITQARALLTPPPLATRPIAGRVLTRAQAPALWALVSEACSRSRSIVPDNLIIGLDTPFHATDTPLYLSSAQTPIEGRSLLLCIPYLAYMTRDELAFLVAQEMAYFTGEDAKYTPRLREVATYTGYYMSQAPAPLKTNADNQWAAPARKLVNFFLTNFTPVLDHWVTERALVVDGLSATAASPEAAALAILRLTTLASVIEPLFAEFTNNGGRSPHPGGLLASVFEAVAKAPTLDPRSYLHHPQPHPREPRLPIGQQIEMLGVAPTAELAQLASSREPSGLLEELGLR